jgi:hypothetical protein
MWLSKIFTALLVVLTGLLPASCTKSKNASAQKKSAPGAPVAAVVETNQNLGEVVLTNYYEADVELGAGRSCRITPKVIDGKNVQLTMALELKKGGQVADLSITQVTARPGESFAVAVGDMNLTLTPKLAE